MALKVIMAVVMNVQNISIRVGSEGLFPSLSSHTTVRTVRYTAVC
jgi:hypothetical protein